MISLIKIVTAVICKPFKGRGKGENTKLFPPGHLFCLKDNLDNRSELSSTGYWFI